MNRLCTIAILLLWLLTGGCSNMSTVGADVPPTPVLLSAHDAFTLSGGKVKHYYSIPGGNTRDKSVLTALRFLPFNADTVRGVTVTFGTSRGTESLHAVKVGKEVLVTVNDFEETMTLSTTQDKPGEETSYANSDHYPIKWTAGSSEVQIGATPVTIRYPVIYVSSETDYVITLSDLLNVLRVRDKLIPSYTIHSLSVGDKEGDTIQEQK